MRHYRASDKEEAVRLEGPLLFALSISPRVEGRTLSWPDTAIAKLA